ncbi:RcnB family protein [Sphingomonas sp. KR3-1]|uniref:RcnB family protein n=1 Tax=Sphingomonas sp. KR3-1 TaxID=3156611 RepID=UPI0032B38F17
MRHLMKQAVMASALLAALPAAAQVTSPGPGWGGRGDPIPAPGGMGPRNVPMPMPPRVSPNPPHMPAPTPVHTGPGVPTAGARVWQNGRWMALPPRGPVQNSQRHGNNGGNRWGGQVNGRWYAGAQAPGGWNNYRRMGRGGHLPNYWMGSGFRIPDYLNWGLAAPPYGYFWVRYYDDAVLVDDRGDVWDSVDGINWADADAYADSGASYSNSYSYSNATVGAGYRQPIQPVDPNDYYDGYSGGSLPPAGAIGAPPAAQVQGYYGSGQAYYGAQGSYQAGAATYYGAPGTTVIVIPGATTTTTTVTEEVVESTAYVRSTARRVIRKAPVRRYRTPAKCCVCGCR